MHTLTALKIYTAICNGIIKSRLSFWRDFSSIDKINSLNLDCSKNEREIMNEGFDIVCCFDNDFPAIDKSVPKNDKPFLFIYKGNLNLLKDISKNVAVVGVLTPDEDITLRENNIVTRLIENDICIVSGLARGCDSIAHKVCLENGGKTVAFLPSTINSIYPAENTSLANSIVENGGLIITEYATESQNYKENIARLIERDRLQAMFANSIVLIASYRKGDGDSGSRHAMLKAKRYNRKRLVMYNKSTDKGSPLFGLNEDMIKDGANILTLSTMKELLN